MSSFRPPHATRPPRPTMHADIPNKWLWCNDNAKVTRWHMNLANRFPYNTFISSFTNYANRAWEKAIDKQSKLSPLDRDIIECLLEEPLSAETMIKTLGKYNRFTGRGKGELKQVGLIAWMDEAPKDAAIEKGAEQLHKLIKKTMPKYLEAEAVRASSMTTSKGKNKGKGKVKAEANTTVNDQVDEDEEMKDAPMEEDQAMTLDGMEFELTNAGNAPAAIDNKGKLKNPVKFGELPYVGSKKGKDVQDKKDDPDEEWKKFFLG